MSELQERDKEEARYTPGPWKMWNGWGPLPSDGLMRAERIGSDSATVLRAFEHDGIATADLEGTQADFELIAAAPLLLEALAGVSPPPRERMHTAQTVPRQRG